MSLNDLLNKRIQPMEILIAILLCILVWALIGSKIVWVISPAFLTLNKAQWLLQDPLRRLVRLYDVKDRWSHRLFWGTFFLGINPALWLMMHILLTPIRLLNALYFNVLFVTLVMRDGIWGLFDPRVGFKNSKERRGLWYQWFWIRTFPVRLLVFFSRCAIAAIGGVIMTGFETIWPTLTMFHGTNFKVAAIDIAQTGRWLVGEGDFAGLGVYFALEQRVAEYFAAKSRPDSAIVVVRVTTSLSKPSGALPIDLRPAEGANVGKRISSSLKWPWYAIEHWREEGRNWYEYCLAQPPEKAYTKIVTWRARPIAVIKTDKKVPERLYKGVSLWTGRDGFVLITCTWILLFLLLSSQCN